MFNRLSNLIEYSINNDLITNRSIFIKVIFLTSDTLLYGIHK
jgi:hypothetical protein